MTDENDDADYVVIRSKVAYGGELPSGPVMQDMYGSLDAWIGELTAGLGASEMRRVVHGLRALLTSTADLTDSELRHVLADKGVGLWASEDDIRVRLENLATDLERRANSTP